MRDKPTHSKHTVMKQEYTSAKTSLNQLPSLIKSVAWANIESHFDIGSGRFYENLLNYTKTFKIDSLVYDPYNIPEEINTKNLQIALESKVDCVTCCNVLNVIKEESCRKEIYNLAKSVLKENGFFCIGVYEGNRSGVGKETLTNSWQNNRPIKDYLEEVKEVFPNSVLKRGYIIAEL